MNANDLIESYVTDVAVRLPRKQRNDVAFELRALLKEELQAKAEATGRDADAAMATELLHAFGRPVDVAARFDHHRSGDHLGNHRDPFPLVARPAGRGLRYRLVGPPPMATNLGVEAAGGRSNSRGTRSRGDGNRRHPVRALRAPRSPLGAGCLLGRSSGTGGV